MNVLKALSRLPQGQVRRLLKASRWMAVRDRLAASLAVLDKRAGRVRRKLDRIERKLAAAGSLKGPKRRKGGRKAARGPLKGRRGAPLRKVLHDVLAKLHRPAATPELAKLALKAGYATRSRGEIFRRAVHQALRTGGEFAKTGRGMFALK